MQKNCSKLKKYFIAFQKGKGSLTSESFGTILKRFFVQFYYKDNRSLS